MSLLLDRFWSRERERSDLRSSSSGSTRARVERAVYFRCVRGGAPKGPEAISAAVRDICSALPETTEHNQEWASNYEIRRRSFCLLAGDESPRGRQPVLVIRASDDDRLMYLAMGHPFFEIPKNKWKIGFVVNDKTDWDEVRELITDSYCLVAPKKLVRLLELPEAGDRR